MNAHFGQCFQAILHEKKITQTEAANILGWSQRTISYYCNAKNTPRAHVLEHIIIKLGFDPTQSLSQAEIEHRILNSRLPSGPPVQAALVMSEAKNLRKFAGRLRADADRMEAAADALEDAAGAGKK